MGGKNEAFQTTRWSEIRNAQSPAVERKREIIDKLLTRYWKPVYCYLRRKGYDNEEAKDLVQGFFTEKVDVVTNIAGTEKQRVSTKQYFNPDILENNPTFKAETLKYAKGLNQLPTGQILSALENHFNEEISADEWLSKTADQRGFQRMGQPAPHKHLRVAKRLLFGQPRALIDSVSGRRPGSYLGSAGQARRSWGRAAGLAQPCQ